MSDCNAVKPQVTATPAGAATADGQRAVCQTLRSMKDAWARHDAISYGDQFTQDATYTSYVGTAYQGRDDIAEGHRALFDGFLKGTKLSDSWLSLRFYGPDTAVATSRGDTYEGGEPEAADLSKTQSYTLVRQATTPGASPPSRTPSASASWNASRSCSPPTPSPRPRNERPRRQGLRQSHRAGCR
ncbi:SgcJ/EcaC family oxidoreductase [Streptomyces sp. b94]|uniref:SgcJ/EcaC family oxidoreductase n=1 Tax=Streptomyces sp. b94 TaxID=1827634 RepID=UPI0027DB1843|nr:SgcJ/EcaC family oxidoreductase [Streptomyces sp. b94]